MTDQIPTKKKKGEKASKLDENGANKVSKQIELVEIKQEQEAIEEEAEIEEELEMEVNDKKGDLVIKNEDFTLDLFEEEKEIEPHSSAAPQQFFKRRGFNRKRKDFSGSAMDNFDTEQFIIEIQSRPSIWDASSADYPNRDLRKKCWEEVVELFGGENLSAREERDLGLVLQKKWKNIRSCFTREIKRQKNVKAGSRASRKTEYTYFQQLQFLQGVVTFKDSQDGEAEELNVENEEFERPAKVIQNKPIRKTPADDPVVNASNNPIKERRQEKEEDDEDRLFLLSLHSTLKEIPKHRKMSTKIKMLSVLHEATQTLRDSSTSVSHSHMTNVRLGHEGHNRPGYLNQQVNPEYLQMTDIYSQGHTTRGNSNILTEYSPSSQSVSSPTDTNVSNDSETFLDLYPP